MAKMTRDEFDRAVVAQKDDCDYSENGYVAFVHDGVAYLAHYSHCSCYGTFTALCGGGFGDSYEAGEVSYVWSGTPDELRDMARRCADPFMPDRAADESDYDYDHLKAVYAQILA